ncbi:hypothetical protein [Aquimarina rhabdastrellae]
MLKNILKLSGVQSLNTTQKKEITGGNLQAAKCCDPALECCWPSPQPVQCDIVNPKRGCFFQHTTNCCI